MSNTVRNCIDFTGCDEKLFKSIQEFMLSEIEDEVLCFDFNKLIPMPESLSIKIDDNTKAGKTLANIIDKENFNPDDKFEDSQLLYTMKINGIIAKNRLYFTAAEAKRFAKEVDQGKQLLFIGRIAIENVAKYGHESWYEWRINNWNTKWNAIDACVDEHQMKFLFDTAWNFPKPIAMALIDKFPEAEFIWLYADERRGINCGYFEYKDHEVSSCEYDRSDSESYEIYNELYGLI